MKFLKFCCFSVLLIGVSIIWENPLLAQLSLDEDEILLMQADQRMANNEYKQAVDLYETFYQHQPKEEIALKIGECFFYLDEFKMSKNWYEKGRIREFGYLSPNYIQHYAILLSKDGKDKEAQKFFDEVLKERQEKNVAAEESGDSMKPYFDENVKVELTRPAWSSNYPEFAAKYYGDNELAFITSKNLFSQDTVIDIRDGQYDIFKVNLNTAKSKRDLQEFSAMNSKNVNEGPFDFYNNDNAVIITRNIRLSRKELKELKEKGKKKDIIFFRLGLYTTEKENGKWNSLKEFPLNSEGYSLGHPAMLNDGKTLIFSSTMEGGYGKNDLYRTDLVNGHWTKPKNMGPSVNTADREVFPVIFNNNIFMASDGEDSQGGLDIFRITMKGGDYVRQNFTSINSKEDDFAITIKDSIDEFYFTTNRIDGIDNIFKANLILENRVDYVFNLKDENNNTLYGSEITILDERFDLVKSFYYTDSTKSVNLDKTHTYLVEIQNDKAFSNEVILYADETLENQVIKDIILKSETNYYGFVGDKKTNRGIADADVTMTDIKTNNRQMTKTDKQGYFVSKVSPMNSYQINVKKGTFESEDVLFSGTDLVSTNSNILAFSEIENEDVLAGAGASRLDINDIVTAPGISDIDDISIDGDRLVLNGSDALQRYTEALAESLADRTQSTDKELITVVNSEETTVDKDGNVMNKQGEVIHEKYYVSTSQGYTVNKSNDIVNENGIVVKKGSYSVNEVGLVIDQNGAYVKRSSIDNTGIASMKDDLDKTNKLGNNPVYTKIVMVENIQYELNQDTPASSEKEKLKKLYKVLHDNNVKFKIISFTDSRGSIAYNKDLSLRRSKNIAKLLKEQGIVADRIIEVVGKGESNLKNKCKDGVPCSERQHRENRRTEIEIVK